MKSIPRTRIPRPERIAGEPGDAQSGEPWTGQALLEFGLILPLLLLVSLAIIEFSRLLTIYSLTSGAARQATRHGTAVDYNDSGAKYYLDCSGIRLAAQRAAAPLLNLIPLAPPSGDISVQYDDGSDATFIKAGAQCESVVDDDLVSGNRIRVTVSTTYQPIVPLVNIPPLPITYVSTRTIIKEISSFPECSDGVDNDLDGLTDYPADFNCSNVDDNTEAAPPGTPLCWPLTINIEPDLFPAVGSITKDAENCPTGFGIGYLDGTVVNLSASAQPGSGYTFLNWSGTNDDGSATTTVTMNVARTVTAKFGECFDLTVAPPSGGSVQGPPETACPGTSKYTGTVTLTATPDEDFNFVNWTKTGTTEELGTDPVLAAAMTEDKFITANFTDICWSLANPIPANGDGWVEVAPSPNCGDGIRYTDGANVTLVANANLGWVFTGWSGTHAPATSDPIGVITMDEDKVDILANFEPKCYTLSKPIIDPNPSFGSVSVNTPRDGTCPDDGNPDTREYLAGRVISMTAVPLLGPFFGWSGDVNGSQPTVSLLMNSDKTVTAHFQGKLHVASINITALHLNGNNWYAQVLVTVVDGAGAAVQGVTVSGFWTNDFNSWPNNPVNPPNLTNAFGQVSFNSATDSCKSNNTCTFVYQVSNLAKTGYVYDPAADSGNPATVVAPP